MSTAPTVTVWHLAGEPDPIPTIAALVKDYAGVCAICTRTVPRTADVNRALGANFTDRSLFRDPSSDRVCPACLWCCSGKPPATLRMWSIVATPDRSVPASNPKAFLQDRPGLYLGARGDDTGTLVAHTLTTPPDGPWTVTIATSGQKHVLPYGHLNDGPGRWVVRMETTTVTATPDEWAHVHTHATALRRLGIPADDVMHGTPRYLKTRDDLHQWSTHNAELTAWLGSPLLSLALWTITKGHLQ